MAESMSAFRDQLLLKALAALSEIADECGASPARKSLSLRFLLAWTWVAAGADPDAKWIWTQFWESATAPRAADEHKRMIDDYIRATAARTALNAICRALGHAPDPDFLQRLRSARNPKAPE